MICVQWWGISAVLKSAGANHRSVNEAMDQEPVSLALVGIVKSGQRRLCTQLSNSLAARQGRETVKVEPLPGTLSAFMSPR
jgi:hypothetical protein